jgi:ATP-dependent protease ClpP protease subunit
MVGKIYIDGQIGAMEDEVGINLIDVIRQVQRQPLAQSFDVFINSKGGYVDVGFDIYDYLKSLQVPINTIGQGLVASIATVIFMAGDTRKLSNGTKFMIHLPSGMVGGTADEINQYSEMLKASENRMVKFYTSLTGLTTEAITPLLKSETWIGSEDALSMGFTTEAEVQLSMVAKFNNLNLDTKMTKEDKGWIEEQFAKFTAMFGTKHKAIVLADANGVEIEFPNVEDGQTPAVGDEATIDGQPAEGEYIMPQLANATVVFSGGAITEIKEAEGDDEMATLKAENEALKQQLAEATAKATAEETAKAEAETKIANIETEFTNFKAQVTAKFETTPSEPAKPKATLETSTYKEKLEKLKKNKK